MCILWAVHCHNKSTFLLWNRHIMWWRFRLNVRSSVPCSREAVQAELDRTQDHTGSGEETEKGLQSVSQSVCTWVWYQWGCFLLWNRNVLADVLWWPRGGRCGPRWEVSSIKQLRPSPRFLPHLRTSYTDSDPAQFLCSVHHPILKTKAKSYSEPPVLFRPLAFLHQQVYTHDFPLKNTVKVLENVFFTSILCFVCSLEEYKDWKAWSPLDLDLHLRLCFREYSYNLGFGQNGHKGWFSLLVLVFCIWLSSWQHARAATGNYSSY